MTETSASLWLEPKNRLLKELGREEFGRILAIKDPEMLQKFLKKQHPDLPPKETWNRVVKVLEALKPVAQAADSLAPEIFLPSNMLYGSLGLIIDLISSRTEILDTVLRTYDYLLSVLPRVDSFADALRESRCLRLAIADAYGAFTTLSIRAIKTFGRGNRLLTLRRFLWVRDRQLFYNSIENIERLVQMARQEAGWLLVDRRQTDDSKALQEIVQNTENILSTLSIENDNLPHKSSMKPVKHCTIPSRNPSFIGRDERIEEMHRHLHQRVGNQSPRQRSVALCGLGGIGKTQLAIEYARRFEDLYQSCFWVTCDSETKVFECFAQIARALELGEADVGQNLVNVKDWLSRTENWLLIFDNAGPPSDMDQFWPQSTNGSILVTTQDTSWLSQEYLTQSFQLDPLIHREGADLVKHIFERKNRAISDFEASSIHVETGGLPLAIRQISWYIIAENIDITEFLRNYRAHKSSKVVDAWGISTTPWYSHTLATFLDVAFEKLTSRAISILGIISLFDVDGIEGDLLRHDSQQSDGEFAILGDAPEYDEDISQLCRYSLILKDRVNGQLHFSAHRQVKRHILDRLTPEQLQPGWAWVIRRLRQRFPRQSPFAGELNDKDPNCALCINHVIALRDAIPIMTSFINEPEVLASLFLDGGIYLWAKGSLIDGEALTGEAKAICDGTEIEGSMTAQIYSFHASILSDSGNIEQGLAYFEKSLEILRRHLRSGATCDADHALLANAWNNLACAHCALGHYDRAEMFNELSLQHKQMLATHGHPMSHLLCLSYHNIANTFAGQERYEEAASFFERALEVATLEESTSRRALTSHNYGIMRLMQDKVDEARELLETAYQLRCERIGDHPDTAASLHMLACCYHRKGDDDSLDIARQLLHDSLFILRSRSSSADESRIARTLFKLSLVQNALGEASAAVSRLDARSLYSKLTGKLALPTSEEEFDDLVPYI